MSYLDLNSLDLDRAYSLREFEYISEQLKNRPIKIKEDFVHHFERDKARKACARATNDQLLSQKLHINLRTGMLGRYRVGCDNLPRRFQN